MVRYLDENNHSIVRVFTRPGNLEYPETLMTLQIIVSHSDFSSTEDDRTPGVLGGSRPFFFEGPGKVLESHNYVLIDTLDSSYERRIFGKCV